MCSGQFYPIFLVDSTESIHANLTCIMSTRKQLKYKYLKTKIALSQTIQQLLEINRKRRFFREDPQRENELNEELKVLNATAEIQARTLRNYQESIQKLERA